MQLASCGNGKRRLSPPAIDSIVPNDAKRLQTGGQSIADYPLAAVFSDTDLWLAGVYSYTGSQPPHSSYKAAAMHEAESLLKIYSPCPPLERWIDTCKDAHFPPWPPFSERQPPPSELWSHNFTWNGDVFIPDSPDISQQILHSLMGNIPQLDGTDDHDGDDQRTFLLSCMPNLMRRMVLLNFSGPGFSTPLGRSHF
jgi:hypothetical protein